MKMEREEKMLEQVCKQLDNLILRSLELVEEKVVSSVELENLLRDGQIDMAKARYIQGKETVGMLCIPQDKTIKRLFELEKSLTSKEFITQLVPQYDIHLRNKEEEIGNPLRWFGVLVPSSLRIAQRKFQESFYLIARIANIVAELEVISTEYLMAKKTKLQLNKCH